MRMGSVIDISANAKGWDDLVRVATETPGRLLVSSEAILEGKRRIESSCASWYDAYETSPDDNTPVAVYLRDGSVRTAIMYVGGWFCSLECMTPLDDDNLPEYWLPIPVSDIEEKHFSGKKK